MAGSFAPVVSVAKKLLLLSVAELIGREKLILGRKVLPISFAPLSGVKPASIRCRLCGRLTVSDVLTALPAASLAEIVS